MNILVVEDEAYTRRVLISILNKLNPNNLVLGAENGEEALKLMEEQNFHVVMTDIQMPVMGGIELMENIKAKQPQVFVVIISGYNYFEYAKAAITNGAVDYLLKPMDPTKIEELLTRLEEDVHNQMYQLFKEKFYNVTVGHYEDYEMKMKALNSVFEEYTNCTSVQKDDVFFEGITSGKHEMVLKQLSHLENKSIHKEPVNFLWLYQYIFNQLWLLESFLSKELLDKTVSKLCLILNEDCKFPRHSVIEKMNEVLINLIKEIEARQGNQNEHITNEIIDYINTHYQEDISLDHVAVRFHYNASYFSVLFKKATNKTYRDYIKDLRIEKAKELLRKSNMRVKDVGCKVGYKDYQYFCKVFKRICKVTPSDYRRLGGGC